MKTVDMLAERQTEKINIQSPDVLCVGGQAMDSFYSDEELKQIGFKKYGTDVKISRKASIYRPEEIELGDHVRIDDFCFLLGKIKIGSYVHIAPYTNMVGGDAGGLFGHILPREHLCCI